MRCNIYMGNKLLEQDVFFFTLQKAELYCRYACPLKYGSGDYHAVIVRR